MPVFGRSSIKDIRAPGGGDTTSTDTSTLQSQSSPTHPSVLQKSHPPPTQSNYVDRKTSSSGGGSRKLSFFGGVGGGSKRREMTSASVDDITNLDLQSSNGFGNDFGTAHIPSSDTRQLPPPRPPRQVNQQPYPRTVSNESIGPVMADKQAQAPVVVVPNVSGTSVARKPVQPTPDLDKIESGGVAGVSSGNGRGRVTIEQAQQKMKMAIEAERMADIALENARRQVREVKELMTELQKEADEEAEKAFARRNEIQELSKGLQAMGRHGS